MELTSHHQPQEVGKGQQETPKDLPISHSPPCWDPSWLSNVCTTKDLEPQWLIRENLDSTWPKTRDCKPHGRQFSWAHLPSCSPLGCPFPIKSLALSALDNPFLSVRQELSLGPWKGSPFLQQKYRTLSPIQKVPSHSFPVTVCHHAPRGKHHSHFFLP